MIEVFNRAEAVLSDLLNLPAQSGWNSLDVNYHHPRVERLWRPFEGEYRLMLHCIHPCTPEESLYHPHPWPSVVRVIQGTYWMKAGSGPGLDPPPITMDVMIKAWPNSNFVYAMLHPDGWHQVVPLERPVYSVMVIGKPWNRPIPEVSEVIKGSLPPLSPIRVEELLAEFRAWYPR